MSKKESKTRVISVKEAKRRARQSKTDRARSQWSDQKMMSFVVPNDGEPFARGTSLGIPDLAVAVAEQKRSALGSPTVKYKLQERCVRVSSLQSDRTFVCTFRQPEGMDQEFVLSPGETRYFRIKEKLETRQLADCFGWFRGTGVLIELSCKISWKIVGV